MICCERYCGCFFISTESDDTVLINLLIKVCRVLTGFKSEWATVKDNYLYVGSMGKEWTTSKGVYVNHNPMWIKMINPTGEIKHVDWQNNFRKLRQSVDIDFPGVYFHILFVCLRLPLFFFSY